MLPLHAPTCVLVLIAKDEGPYLIEWIAWHRRLGFAEIVIYDNMSTDGSSDLLAALDAAGVVVVRPWSLGATESPQITAYNDAITKATADWILFIDTDEFLVLHQHADVGSFLALPNSRDEVASVGINWRFFGDSGLAAPDGRPVTRRFTRGARPDFPNNAHVKSFTRRDRIQHCDNMHMCHVRGERVHASGQPLLMQTIGLTDTVEYEVAQINHYFTRTAAEYEDKKRRGRGGFAHTAPEKYNYDLYAFKWHNRNEVEDLCAARLGAELETDMAKLEAIIARG